MDPKSAYREGAARGASGARLVVLLYEQAVQDLRRVVMAIDQGDVEGRTKHVNHAIVVIGHLQATVDRERGGQVSRNLDRFYCGIRSRVIEAHVQVSREILYEQISLLLSVREAWIEVDHATPQEVTVPSSGASRDTETFTPSKAAASDWRG